MTVETLQVPVYRPFAVRVARLQRLSPSFLRVTFTGPDLDACAPNGWDQRIKVLLPLPGRGMSDCPPGADWYGEWRALPEAQRNPIRTYTVRDWRPDLREMDVDFVLHGSTGPASAWAERAAVGDEIALIAPERTLPRPDRRVRVAPTGRRLVPARRRRRDGGPRDLRDRRVPAGRAAGAGAAGGADGGRRPPPARPGRRRDHLAPPLGRRRGRAHAARPPAHGRRDRGGEGPDHRHRAGPRRAPGRRRRRRRTSCGRCRRTTPSAAARRAPTPGSPARPGWSRACAATWCRRRASTGPRWRSWATGAWGRPATDVLRLTPCQRAVSHGEVTGARRRPGDGRAEHHRNGRLLRARGDPDRARRRRGRPGPAAQRPRGGRRGRSARRCGARRSADPAPPRAD